MSLEAKARAALRQGDLATASSAARALVLEDTAQPTGYYLLGLTVAELGDMAKAIPLLEAAIQRGPHAEHLAQLARILSQLHRDEGAARAARDAYQLAPDDAHTLDTIGCVFTRLGDHEGAIEPFLRAVAADPGNADYAYNLAAACGFTGRVDEARQLYERILETDPDNSKVHYALAILSRQTADSNHVTRLEASLARASDPADLLRIRYALAKELEDLGDTGAFGHLTSANDQHKRELAYDFAQDEAIFDAIEMLFRSGEGAPLLTNAGHGDAAPIFIIGMPRTGTTLVDRIISSHPEVGSAGELQAMPLAVKKFARTPSRTVIDADTVAASGACDPADIGKLYMAQAAQHRPQGFARFVDKLPANFLYAGHIARSLPNARIVCLRRAPMDTVWSNFKNLFASQSAYYAYSYDLMDIARYYARFDRLMGLWEELFLGRILQLGYEDLVANQEAETRRLLDHCDLTWDEACLHFHQNRSAVATPSAAQVRRSLNADAVGKWRRYADELEPVRSWFESQGIATD